MSFTTTSVRFTLPKPAQPVQGSTIGRRASLVINGFESTSMTAKMLINLNPVTTVFATLYFHS